MDGMHKNVHGQTAKPNEREKKEQELVFGPIKNDD